MAAKKKSNPIALPLQSYQSKIEEFQEYLDSTKIKSILDDDKRHDEIKIQVLMMEKLGPLLRELKTLLTVEEEKVDNDIRGDLELSPLERGLI